jgi:glucosamine--fructose-6-phosphate aminotransferase (isomerizing)
MCGITACIGVEDALQRLLIGLENLEYRGYDSAGIALTDGTTVSTTKTEGTVATLADGVRSRDHGGQVGIGHTRWSTHGPPTDENAHPHTDCAGEVAVVHNGIIDNYAELRARLSARGHEFTSETDTEVIPHLVEHHRSTGASVETAFRRAIDALEGSYAIAMITAEDETVYATRQGSPLVLGVADEASYLASDVPAFLEFTDDVVYLDDGDVVAVDPDGYEIHAADGTVAHRPVRNVEWSAEDAEKGSYDHFMLKEIHEQPVALRQAMQGRIDGDEVIIEELPEAGLDGVEAVQLVACGTSYHAAVYGAQLLTDRGIPARAYLASEYDPRPTPAERTLVVGVTQSGETADTLAALRLAKQYDCRTLAVTNVVGSTAARECDETVYIRAGPEIGVAATKTFSSQVATLTLLAERLAHRAGEGYSDDVDALLSGLEALPEQVQQVLNDSAAASLSERYRSSDAYFFIGRGVGYPVALEGALKLKEISYEHAEGFAAGELKHGPLALVTSETPVFALFTGRHTEKVAGNVKEVRARGAPVVAIASEDDTAAAAVADETLTVPSTHPDLTGLLGNVQLQLLSYHTATLLDRPIDKPRNLAKSVTVE